MLWIKRLYDLRGMTMVEVLVTISVLAVVICPLMSMFVFSQKLNAESSMEYEAAGRAKQIMEEIKASDYTDISKYFYNGISCSYERKIHSEDGMVVEVMIRPDDLRGLLTIEIICKKNEQVVACLKGSKICGCLK